MSHYIICNTNIDIIHIHFKHTKSINNIEINLKLKTCTLKIKYENSQKTLFQQQQHIRICHWDDECWWNKKKYIETKTEKLFHFLMRKFIARKIEENLSAFDLIVIVSLGCHLKGKFKGISPVSLCTNIPK